MLTCGVIFEREQPARFSPARESASLPRDFILLQKRFRVHHLYY